MEDSDYRGINVKSVIARTFQKVMYHAHVKVVLDCCDSVNQLASYLLNLSSYSSILTSLEGIIASFSQGNSEFSIINTSVTGRSLRKEPTKEA